MSAEIGSVETKTGADVSVEEEAASGVVEEEAASGVGGLNIGSHDNLPSDEVDAADFLLSNSKYHDCFLTVGNPECEKVEEIGIVSLYLIANSPVFRKMLENCKQTELPQSKMNITDVSPATFKLMMRCVYGGKLPKITAIQTAGLALCADKYKIPRLLQKSLKRLLPLSAEDVFPALICVTYGSFPDLEVVVTKIIQQETDKVVQNTNFLKLDENCVLFMVKQDTLNIDEVVLWNHVVRWAENQSGIKTVRDYLAKILGYVRFLTFTIEEILEHVLPKEVLSPEEYVDLCLGLTKTRTLRSPLLCKIQERRNPYKEEAIPIPAVGDAERKVKAPRKVKVKALQEKPETVIFNNWGSLNISDFSRRDLGVSLRSTCFTIKPTGCIQVVSFKCKSVDIGQSQSYRYGIMNPDQIIYQLICYITVSKIIEDVIVSEKLIRVEDWLVR